MAYVKTNWVNGSTALSDDNMNHIETGIKEVHDFMDAFIESFYPIGKIVMSTEPDNPNTKPLLANTEWIPWGSGRVPVGVNASDNDFKTPEKVGGDKTHAHTNPTTGASTGNTGASSGNTGTSSGSTGGASTETTSGSSATNTGSTTLTSAQSGVPAHLHPMPHTHNMAHTHTGPNHRHAAVGDNYGFVTAMLGDGHAVTRNDLKDECYKFKATSPTATVVLATDGVMTVKTTKNVLTAPDDIVRRTYTDYAGTGNTGPSSATNTQGASTANTSNNTAANASSGHTHTMAHTHTLAHTHSLNNHTHSLNNHTHSLNNHTHTQGNTGSSSSLQPYITCYMWKRVG